MVSHLGVRPSCWYWPPARLDHPVARERPGFWMIQSFFKMDLKETLPPGRCWRRCCRWRIGDDVAAGGGAAVVEMAAVRGSSGACIQ